MFKKFVSSLIVMLLVVGCSSNKVEETPKEEEVAEFNIADVTKKLCEDLGLYESLSEFPSNRMNAMLFQNDEEALSEGALYLSSDKKADTIGLFKTDNKDKCIEYINTYIESLKDRANNYTPEETFKIDKAIVETNEDGSLVAFVICDDIELAKEKVNEILGK